MFTHSEGKKNWNKKTIKHSTKKGFKFQSTRILTLYFLCLDKEEEEDSLLIAEKGKGLNWFKNN